MNEESEHSKDSEDLEDSAFDYNDESEFLRRHDIAEIKRDVRREAHGAFAYHGGEDQCEV